MRIFLVPLLLLLIPACDRAADNAGTAIDDILPNSQQPPLPGNAVGPVPPDNKPRVDAGDAGEDGAREDGPMPAAFHGRWAGSAAECGDPAAPLELRVTPTSLIFHESVGTVTAVTPAGDGAMTVDADFTGEGESWSRRLLLRASDDGRRLTVTNDGTAVTRQRCPAT